MEHLKVACIIPTYNGLTDIIKLLNSLECQTLKPDILIIDSSSTDGTKEYVKEKFENALAIPTKDFNHGKTRQLVVEKNPDYDIYIFITQDAYCDNENAIKNILSPFQDPKVGAVCGRQLPHINATPMASHARLFNYPEISSTKSFEDKDKLGLKTAFISNSFSAYRKEALLEVGGFPNHVILSEDMYVAAKQILNGWKIVYQANAVCRHSHNYTLTQEFKRYFDQGVFHSREKWICESFGGAGSEGLKYVLSELKYLGYKRLHLWPSSLLRNFLKLVAYKSGHLERILPFKIKKNLSMHKRFWDSPYAEVKK